MRFATVAAIAAASVMALVVPSVGSAENAPLANCTHTMRPGGGLQRFVTRLRAGDVGCLTAGYYDIHRLILGNRGNAQAPIVLRSLDPNHPATLHGVVWLSSAGRYWIVEDLRIDGRNKWNLPSPIVNGSHSIWRRLDVSNRGSGDGTQPYGGGICFNLGQTDRYGPASNTTIEESRIHDCGLSTNHNHGIYAVATTGTTIDPRQLDLPERRPRRAAVSLSEACAGHSKRDRQQRLGRHLLRLRLADIPSRHRAANIISNSRNRWNVESFYPAGTPLGHRQYRGAELFLGNSRTRYYRAHGGISVRTGSGRRRECR